MQPEQAYNKTTKHQAIQNEKEKWSQAQAKERAQKRV